MQSIEQIVKIQELFQQEPQFKTMFEDLKKELLKQIIVYYRTTERMLPLQNNILEYIVTPINNLNLLKYKDNPIKLFNNMTEIIEFIERNKKGLRFSMSERLQKIEYIDLDNKDKDNLLALFN